MGKNGFKDLLQRGERIQYRTQQPIWCRIESSKGQTTAKYSFCITNRRLLWRKPSFLGDTVIAELKTSVCDVSYSETGFIRRDGLITIQLPDARIWLKGSTTTMRTIYEQIRSLPELRKSFSEKQAEKERIKRKKQQRQKERQQAAERQFRAKELDLEDQINAEPQNPLPYFELGRLYEESGRLYEQWSWNQKMEHCYTKALALGLADPLQRGIAHAALGQGRFPGLQTSLRSPTELYHLQEAAKEFNIALKINSEDAEAATRLALVYKMLGKQKEEGRMVALVREIEARKNLGAAPNLTRTSKPAHRTGISFEEKCMRLLEKQGFNCQRTAITGDGGVDIVATSNLPLLKGTYIVQCKDWKNPVGEPPVRDLYGVVASENANKGILITSSAFTDAARNFARGKNIELIDGDQLEQLIRQNRLEGRSSDKWRRGYYTTQALEDP